MVLQVRTAGALTGSGGASAAQAESRITLVTMRMSQHASSSGYDRVAEYIDGVRIGPPAGGLGARVLGKLGLPLVNASRQQWYHRKNFVQEAQAAWSWLCASRPRVFHFLYGENSYHYLGLLKAVRGRHRIVCTFHTPPERFEQVVRKRDHLQRVDAAVVLSRDLIPYYEELIGPGRVFYVPHGIDTGYFTPPPARPSQGRVDCLFVGSHLRDFETLESVARLLRGHANVHLHVVTKAENHARFASLENVTTYAGLPEWRLRDLYRQASLFVMPLKQASANNALLEALACGLPVVVTDLSAVRDYVTPENAVLTPPADACAMAQAVLELGGRPDALKAMGRASRHRAEEFSFPATARQLTKVYQAVLNGHR